MDQIATTAPRAINPVRRLLSASNPWYHWGSTFIERMDTEGEGPGHFLSLQWLGISVTIFFGRTPKREG